MAGKQIHLKIGKKDLFFNTSDLVLVEVNGNYCSLYFRNGRCESNLRITRDEVMKEINKVGSFVSHHLLQAGRSDIINVDYIANMDKSSHTVLLGSKFKVILSAAAFDMLSKLVSVPGNSIIKTVTSPIRQLSKDPLSLNNKYGNAFGHDFVDLGLTSGTLWATKNAIESIFGNVEVYPETDIYSPESVWEDYLQIHDEEEDQADEEMALMKDEFIKSREFLSWDREHWVKPSVEQWEELIRECEWIPYCYKTKRKTEYGALLKGPNGNYLVLPTSEDHLKKATYLSLNPEDTPLENDVLRYSIGLDGLEPHVDHDKKDVNSPLVGQVRLVFEKVPDISLLNPENTRFDAKGFVVDSSGGIYSKNGAQLGFGPNIKEYKVKDGTRFICFDAFNTKRYLGDYGPEITKKLGDRSKNLLESISLPASVISIGDEAFAGCVNLKSLAIANDEKSSLMSIGNKAFYWCKSLADISIPQNVCFIGADAFDCCVSLTAISLPKEIKKIAKRTFSHCESLREIDIPSKVEKIDEGAFNECPSLVKVTLPESLLSIEKAAFKDCSSLQEIEIPDNVQQIGEEAFIGCDKLNKVNIKGSIKIGDFAFRHCKAIKELSLPDGLESIGLRAFNGLEELHKLNIRSAAIIEDFAFLNCTNLQELILPDNLMRIGRHTFDGCENLEKVRIPHAATIDECAFEDCKKLRVVYLPDNVDTIAKDAFNGCQALEHIFVSENSYSRIKAMMPQELKRKVAMKI